MSSWAGAIERSTNLVELEAIVERGRHSFIEVGLALARIRDAKLYKSTHSSWEAYCQQRWGWGASYAYKLARSAEVAAELGMDPGPHFSERHARELQGVPAEQRAEVLAEAGEGATVVDLRGVIERRVDGKAKPPSIQTRRTPRWLFDALSGLFGPFALDAYAEPHNALCERFYTREQDGNAQLWEDATFGNPEFEDMGPPCAKAVKEADDRGVRSVLIAPVGCSQAWYHELAIRGTVYVPDRRINFDLPDGTPTDRADRDTVILAFGKEHRNSQWNRGVFRVQRLGLKALAPREERGE